jgi:hypothetical protein
MDISTNDINKTALPLVELVVMLEFVSCLLENGPATTRFTPEGMIFDKVILNLATKIVFALGYCDKGKVPDILSL